MATISNPRLNRPALASEEVAGVRITLDAGETRLLELEWRADGELRRQGNGRHGQRQLPMVAGRVAIADFEAVRRHITSELLACRGRYTDRTARGIACRLEIVLDHRLGTKWSTLWSYGAESTGPPEPVRRFVSELVRLTARWYDQGTVQVRDSLGAR
jgi:hypothetical protein